MKDRLLRLALRITLNREEAEDVVQDTLLKMWDKRDEWNQMQSLEAMAMTICRNRALDIAGKAGRGNLMLDVERDSPISSTNPERKLEEKESLQAVRDIINSMPEVQRTIIELREIEGKEYCEIAQILQLTETQVRVYLHRARQRIKTEYEKIL